MQYTPAYSYMKTYQPSDDLVCLIIGATQQDFTTTTSPVKKKEIVLGANVNPGSKFKFSFEAMGFATGRARIYRNGVAVGTLQSLTTSWASYAESLSETNWNPGDAIQLYVWSTDSTAQSVRNFKLLGIGSDWRVTL